MWLASPAVQGQDITTTRTDYVNKYPSIIQITSYNFTGTQTTAERCVGVVNHCIIKIPLSMLQTWKCYKGRKNCRLSFFRTLTLSYLIAFEWMVQQMKGHGMRKSSSGGPCCLQVVSVSSLNPLASSRLIRTALRPSVYCRLFRPL